MYYIHITTAADLNMAPCLHSTLLSCLDQLNPKYSCCFHLYLKDFKAKDVNLIKETLKSHDNRYELIVHDVAKIALPAGKGISGNRMSYILFTALNQCDTDHVIWIDADMIVLTDLSVVWDQLTKEEERAFVVARRSLRFAHPMERRVMLEYGMKEDDPFFNAGFIGTSTKKFRDLNGYQKCNDFINKHPEQSDQGAVNFLFKGRLCLLDHKYNTPHWPNDRSVSLDPKDIICHFIGSPKPWDLFGNYIHPSYSIFESWVVRTAYSSRYKKRYFSYSAWRRFLRISYKYWPVLKAKLGIN